VRVARIVTLISEPVGSPSGKTFAGSKGQVGEVGTLGPPYQRRSGVLWRTWANPLDGA
jgi:hypothetical protein